MSSSIYFKRLFKLQTASFSTRSAIFLSLVASVNASIDSILAVSASRDDSFSGGVAKGAKSTLAFTIKGSIIDSKVIFAGFTTVRKAVDSIFSRVVVTGRGHDNASKENNGLFQKLY